MVISPDACGRGDHAKGEAPLNHGCYSDLLSGLSVKVRPKDLIRMWLTGHLRTLLLSQIRGRIDNVRLHAQPNNSRTNNLGSIIFRLVLKFWIVVANYSPTDVLIYRRNSAARKIILPITPSTFINLHILRAGLRTQFRSSICFPESAVQYISQYLKCCSYFKKYRME